MPLRLRFLAFAVSLLLVPAVPCAAPTATSRAATFLFSGTIAEPGGRPVRGAKVLLEGLAEPAAVTDAEGRYSFSYAVPDVAALAAAPLRLVLRASHKGWNLALATGESALVAELRFVRAADGSARLEVRSSDAGLASALAVSFRVPGDATVAWRGDFTRQIGAEDRSQPKLTTLEIVSVAPPAPATGVATAPPVVARADSAAAPATRPDSAKTAPPVAVPSPVLQLRPERPESMRLFPSAPEPGTTPKPAPTPARVPDRAPVVTRATPAVPALPAPPGDSLLARVMAKEKIVNGSGPLFGPLGWGVVLDTASRPGIRVSVRPDTTAPAPEGAGSVAGAGGGSALRVALGRALPNTQPPALAGRACECLVKGTVEVSSDRPLRGALRVVVSLANAPALRDTVVLFMGSPRPFDLGPVPCGSHRLDVHPLSSRRFAVAPPALAVFDCLAGRTQQFRVVLASR